MRTLIIAVACTALLGCHAPKPDLSVFGTSKVPTHGTGAYQTKDELEDDSYYSPDEPAGRSPRQSSQRRRNDGRLLAIDVTETPEADNRGNESREILISRDRRGVRTGANTETSSPRGIRAATRPRDDDDGFRSVPVRITRSGVERASFTSPVTDSGDAQESAWGNLRGTSAAQILTDDDRPIDRASRDGASRDGASRDGAPRELGSRTDAFREVDRSAGRTQRSSVANDGWSER